MKSPQQHPRREPADPSIFNSIQGANQLIRRHSAQKGAVLLIAILVSSVALAVGLGVFNRTYKELLFASFWKQTQVAFFAADSGLECALHWQLKVNPGPTAFCFGAAVAGWTPGTVTPVSGVDVYVPGGGCVNLQIVTDGTSTTTTARGYDVSCVIMNAGTNPRMVERGLRVSI